MAAVHVLIISITLCIAVTLLHCPNPNPTPLGSGVGTVKRFGGGGTWVVQLYNNVISPGVYIYT